MGVYFDYSKKQITKKINELLQNVSYSNISSIIDKWPTIEAFCTENNLSAIFSRRDFSSQFTNDDYLQLLKQLEEEMKINKDNENKIVKTKIDDKVFVAYNNGEQQQTLVGVESVNKENTDSKENTQLYFDEYGNMTNTVQVTNDSGNSYYTVDEVNGSKDLVGHEASETKNTGANAKVKVKTKTGIPSAAFANTLILSFIIGSFFGIVFLAIYIKVMH